MRRRLAQPHRRQAPSWIRALQEIGAQDGAAWRSAHGSGSDAEAIAAANAAWSRRAAEPAGRRDASWSDWLARGKAYVAGFGRGAGISAAFVPVPLQGTASAVLYAAPGDRRIAGTLAALAALPLQETIVVTDGGDEYLYAIAKTFPNVTIACIPGLYDADVGRALGAKLVGADIVLVTGGQSAGTAEQYARFLWACDGRLDVALNDRSSNWGTFAARPDEERYGELLNATLRRPDLLGNTLGHLPYALSRQALDALGPSALAVPPKAHAAALLGGLAVGTAGAVAVDRSERTRPGHWRRTAGDYIEAWSEAFALRGSRLHFPDTFRNRSALGAWTR